jgi:hypothetical protein
MADSSATATDPARAATDSPWFWAMLFASAALIGLVVIAPKYTIRHDNIQRQDEGRWEVWRRHGEKSSEGADTKFSDEYVDVRQHEPTFSLSSQSGLWILQALLIGLVIFTTVAWRRDVWRERPRAATRTDDMPIAEDPGGTVRGAARR